MNNLNTDITEVTGSMSEINFTVEELASKSLRVMNFLFDSVFVGGAYWLYMYLNKHENPWVLYGMFFSYYLLFETFAGRTVGKMFTNTRVITDGGQRASFVHVLKRSLARLIPFEPISCLAAPKAYGWHDRLSKTVVVTESTIQRKEILLQ